MCMYVITISIVDFSVKDYNSSLYPLKCSSHFGKVKFKENSLFVIVNVLLENGASKCEKHYLSIRQ